MKTRMFSIRIPTNNLMKYPKQEWDRLIKFFQDQCEGECTAYRDPVGQVWTFTGTASSKVISVLMAVARGHDVALLLDKFEKETANGTA